MIMPNMKATVNRVFLLLCCSMFLLVSCTETSESERLRQYIASINGAEPTAPTAAPVSLQLPASGTAAGGGVGTSIITGTPRVVKDGFCGDGIINGSTEDCDQGAIQNTSCRDYNGLSGEVTCQSNCLYDISRCITPEIDRQIGGVSETCRCNCQSGSCRGGCAGTNMVGQSVCRFQCDNPCVCRCEGKLEAHVVECDFRCACTVSTLGTPDCDCSLDQCEVISTISPNIATLAGAKNSGGHR